MIRLDTYPEAQITARMNPGDIPSNSPMLCCLLHTGTLPPSQQVQVWVGEVQQEATQEETQQVFSWKCAEGIEMSIHLLQHGRLMKAWRGWWQGETSIAHTGTLVVQVYCAGVLQPAGLTSLPTPVLSSAIASTDQQNGAHQQDIAAAFTWPTLLDAPPFPLPATRVEQEDDLWRDSPQGSQPRTDEVSENEGSENETAYHLLEEDDLEKSPCEEEDLEDGVFEEVQEGGEEEAQENRGIGGARGQIGADASQEQTDVSPVFPLAIAPPGTMVAAFPAATVWSQAAHQEAETRLTELLATMPPNTILVDLRQQNAKSRARRSAAKSGPQKLGLSKELLRTLYGGRYWDRGSAIQTSRRLESAHPLRWRRTVLNPNDREGLGTLVTTLAKGFSLVILDGEMPYAESARAAVIAELRQRVANIHEGPCS